MQFVIQKYILSDTSGGWLNSTIHEFLQIALKCWKEVTDAVQVSGNLYTVEERYISITWEKNVEPFTKHVCETCPQLFNLAQRRAVGCVGLSHCHTCVSTKHTPFDAETWAESGQWQGDSKDEDRG